MKRPYFIFLATFIGIIIIFISIVIWSFFRPETPNELSGITSPTPVAGNNGQQVTPKIGVNEGEASFSPAEQLRLLKQRRQAEEAYTLRRQKMPFVTKLPYGTNHYKIEITAASDTIFITTLGSESYQESYRQEALQWIRDNGGNTQSIIIVYR